MTILDDMHNDITMLHILSPSSRHLSPKLRVFIDFMVDNLLPIEQPDAILMKKGR